MKQKRILSWVMAFVLIFAVAISETKVYATDSYIKYVINKDPESVKIEGIQIVGNTLKTQFFTDTGTEFKSALVSTYRWYRLSSENSDGILVGENETYVLSESDIDQYIKVVVSNNGNTFQNTIGKIGEKSSSIILGVITYGYWLNNNDGIKMYYENGNPITGWRQIDGVYYIFNSNGIMQTGWCRSNNKVYYLNSNGVMVTGWINIDGKLYYFDSDGSMK